MLKANVFVIVDGLFSEKMCLMSLNSTPSIFLSVYLEFCCDV